MTADLSFVARLAKPEWQFLPRIAHFRMFAPYSVSMKYLFHIEP